MHKTMPGSAKMLMATVKLIEGLKKVKDKHIYTVEELGY